VRDVQRGAYRRAGTEVVPVIALYPLQAEALAAIGAAAAARQHRQVVGWVISLGTMVLFAHLLACRPGRARVLAHRDELLVQAATKLQLVLPEAHLGVVQVGCDEISALIAVGSVQTFSRRRRLNVPAPDFSSVVIDEAHHTPSMTSAARPRLTRR
jgi:superfamily II DNA or RNA helicase